LNRQRSTVASANLQRLKNTSPWFETKHDKAENMSFNISDVVKTVTGFTYLLKIWDCKRRVYSMPFTILAAYSCTAYWYNGICV